MIVRCGKKEGSYKEEDKEVLITVISLIWDLCLNAFDI